MVTRNFSEKDRVQVELIFNKYWHDSFRLNLSDKLSQYLNKDQIILDQDFRFSVLENEGEILAVSGMRKAPDHMNKYAQTNNPAEFYVLAVKEKRKGYGKILKNERIKIAKEAGYTEALFFSGNSHKDSWPFHDSYAERISEMVAPNGEKGCIWSVLF